MAGESELRSIPAAAFDVLRAYLDARAAFSSEQMDMVRASLAFKRLAAGEFLQRAGDVVRHAAFIASGCLRQYVIDDKGKEHTVLFAPETWWLADSNSLQNHTPSPYFIDAIEDSELLLLDWAGHHGLVARVPPYAEAHRVGLHRHNAAKDQRIVSSLSASAEERYVAFVGAYPSIVNRVPQSMLASYLGVTPETVSRIRRNLARKTSPRVMKPR